MQDQIAGVVGFGLGPLRKEALDGIAHGIFVIAYAVGLTNSLRIWCSANVRAASRNGRLPWKCRPRAMEQPLARKAPGDL